MRTRKKFPAYDISSPKFPPLFWLYDNLAYQDSSFQANQIILEFFDDYLINNKINGKELIRKLSIQYKISAGTDDLERIKEMIAESYIIQTYNIAELFFKEFNRTFRKINKIENWKTSITVGKSNKKLDPLNQLLHNLESDKRNQLNGLPEYIIANYYRLLRNGYVHREIKKSVSLRKPSAYYKTNVLPFDDHFNNYYKEIIPDTGNLAPNPPDLINHRDFVLYSRAIRNLANYLNELCSMTVEQAFSIAESDAKFLNTPKKKNYHKFPNVKPRVDKYLEKYYESNFGNSEEQITEFKTLFYAKY